jgi:hypothetical protein
MVQRQNSPCSSLSTPPLYALCDPHTPTNHRAAPHDPVVFQQRFFYLCRLPGSSTQPVKNRFFFDPFDARNAANAHPFRQQRQGFQDRLTRGLASIEHRAARFSERPTAALAPVALRTVLGFSEANNPRLLDVAVQLTLFVWAKLPHLGQFVRHVSLEHHSLLALFYQQHRSGRLPPVLTHTKPVVVHSLPLAASPHTYQMPSRRSFVNVRTPWPAFFRRFGPHFPDFAPQRTRFSSGIELLPKSRLIQLAIVDSGEDYAYTVSG